MNWLERASRWKFPSNARALWWINAVSCGQVHIFGVDDVFASDYLIDRAIQFRPQIDGCEECSLAIVYDLMHRYEGELVNGIQN